MNKKAYIQGYKEAGIGSALRSIGRGIKRGAKPAAVLSALGAGASLTHPGVRKEIGENAKDIYDTTNTAIKGIKSEYRRPDTAKDTGFAPSQRAIPQPDWHGDVHDANQDAFYPGYISNIYDTWVNPWAVRKRPEEMQLLRNTIEDEYRQFTEAGINPEFRFVTERTADQDKQPFFKNPQELYKYIEGLKEDPGIRDLRWHLPNVPIADIYTRYGDAMRYGSGDNSDMRMDNEFNKAYYDTIPDLIKKMDYTKRRTYNELLRKNYPHLFGK
jgi:hypothetical protein